MLCSLKKATDWILLTVLQCSALARRGRRSRMIFHWESIFRVNSVTVWCPEQSLEGCLDALGAVLHWWKADSLCCFSMWGSSTVVSRCLEWHKTLRSVAAQRGVAPYVGMPSPCFTSPCVLLSICFRRFSMLAESCCAGCSGQQWRVWYQHFPLLTSKDTGGDGGVLISAPVFPAFVWFRWMLYHLLFGKLFH